ncbi:MAG: methionyl-tRNA formyltransferase [Pseudomonadota bacterium]
MRLIFMGTPAFSVPALEALREAGHEILAVYCQPPRPAGRGKKVQISPVQQRAQELGLAVRHPVTLKSQEAQTAFNELSADAAVIVAYGLLLPQPVLDAPEHGCLNIHASLLPRWRGAAPIQRAIMAGDTQTGICIMRMKAGLDTGPVILQQTTDIGVSETAGQLHDRLSEIGAAAIVEALAKLPDLVPQTQSDVGVSYAHKIDKAEAQIDWRRSASEVDRLIRGMSPSPGAWFERDGARIKVLGASVNAQGGAPGTVLNDHLLIACGSGSVQLTRLQRSGKSPQPVEVFQRGMHIPAGEMLKGRR